uniref:interferon beta n=1 Tax=Myodes glareolus TaxID=447135 RepID=UPI0020200E37|nr:interferon beta [Myodes glareolus]
MSNRWILQAAFLLGFLSITLSINYKELERTQRSSNSACLKLLDQLERRSCLGHTEYFKFPMEVKHPGQMEKKDAAFIIKVMFENIFIVFKNDSSSTGWNESIVREFLGKLHTQIDKLRKILKEVPENERRTSSNYPTIRHLKSYYGRVRRFLEVKEFSSCAWMVVQAEILKNFSILIRLTNIFQN